MSDYKGLKRNKPLNIYLQTFKRKMSDLIVKSKLKELTELNVSGDVYEKVNEVVKSLLKEAQRRAEANGRKTIQARDF